MEEYFCKCCKIIVSLCLTLLISTNLQAGITGKLSGKILDASTKEPLPYANVVLTGTTMGASSDEDGDYFIINIPPGKYNVTASVIGYNSETVLGVEINADRTTNHNFNLQSTSISIQEVRVVSEKPVIRKDLTASIMEISARDIEVSPQINVQTMLKQQRGILLGYANMGKQGYYYSNTPSDALHIRGGRENETLFTLNGIVVNDPLWGGSEFIQNSSGNYIDEFNTLAGTFNAEYGNAMSGVINVITKSGPSDHYIGRISLYTDQFGADKYDQNTMQGDVGLGGPLPLTKGKLTFYVSGERHLTDGYLYGYNFPNWTDSRGKDIDSLTKLPSGNSSRISMDKLDYWNTSLKINYSVLSNAKLTGFFSFSNLRKDNYEHTFKYYPEGNPFHSSDDQFYSVILSHALSANTYYEIGAALQNHTRFLGVYDSWAKYMQTPEEYDPSGSFFVIGENWQWQDERSDVVSGRVAIASQVNKTNLVRIGFNYRGLDLDLESKNPNEEGSFYLNYNHKPKEISAFIQDKMEFADIGLIINVGFRYDLWNMDSPYWTDIIDLFGMKTAETESKSKFSPRLGVSYPVSDKAAFHFAYGHFYQLPSYYLLYQGQRYLESPLDKNWDNYPDFHGLLYLPFTQDNAFRLSNANMDPEKTVSYEAGVQLRLAEDISADITAYYREMDQLIGERFVPEANSGNGLRYADNYDYGSAKGFELTLNKRFSNYFSFRANYTYSKALITSSTPWAQMQIDNPTFRTFTADWDRPHTFNFDVMAGLPGSWDISLSGNFQSGMPYSIKTEPNTERAPFLNSLDLKITKTFQFFGFKPKIYGNVINLLDRKAVYGVYPSSGKPDLPLGIDRTAHNLDVYDLPNNYGPGRQIYFGVQLEY